LSGIHGSDSLSGSMSVLERNLGGFGCVGREKGRKGKRKKKEGRRCLASHSFLFAQKSRGRREGREKEREVFFFDP